MKEIRCDRKRGFGFCLVFAYHPDKGSIMYSGDLQSISEKVEDEPTHHGFMISYRNGIKISKPDVILLGKNNKFHRSFPFEGKGSRLTLQREKVKGRMKFCLYLKSQHMKPILLRSWRKLPKAYIKELGEADLALEQCK